MKWVFEKKMKSWSVWYAGLKAWHQFLYFVSYKAMYPADHDLIFFKYWFYTK